MGLPFSQHDCVGAEVAACDVCEIAPGLSAPVGAEPPGLNDGAFVPDIGDCALAWVVVADADCPPSTPPPAPAPPPPPTNNCGMKNEKSCC